MADDRRQIEYRISNVECRITKSKAGYQVIRGRLSGEQEIRSVKLPALNIQRKRRAEAPSSLNDSYTEASRRQIEYRILRL